MNEKKYLKRLRRALRAVERSEKEEILTDYKEHFAAGRADGKSDAEIAIGLGDPLEVAREHLALQSRETEEADEGSFRRTGSWPRAILATVALVFFNLIFVIGPFFGLCGGLLGLWAASIGPAWAGGKMILSSSATVASVGMGSLSWISAALGMIALTVLLITLSLLLTRGFIWLTLKYVKLNIRVALGSRRLA